MFIDLLHKVTIQKVFGNLPRKKLQKSLLTDEWWPKVITLLIFNVFPPPLSYPLQISFFHSKVIQGGMIEREKFKVELSIKDEIHCHHIGSHEKCSTNFSIMHQLLNHRNDMIRKSFSRFPPRFLLFWLKWEGRSYSKALILTYIKDMRKIKSKLKN